MVKGFHHFYHRDTLIENSSTITHERWNPTVTTERKCVCACVFLRCRRRTNAKCSGALCPAEPHIFVSVFAHGLHHICLCWCSPWWMNTQMEAPDINICFCFDLFKINVTYLSLTIKTSFCNSCEINVSGIKVMRAFWKIKYLFKEIKLFNMFVVGIKINSFNHTRINPQVGCRGDQAPPTGQKL